MTARMMLSIGLVVGCARPAPTTTTTTATTTVTSVPATPDAAPAPPAPPPVTATWARYDVSLDRWIEIAVDGTGGESRYGCEVTLARYGTLYGPFRGRVGRACAVRELPVRRSPGTVLLVWRVPLDQYAPMTNMPISSGTTTDVQRFATPAECEAAKRARYESNVKQTALAEAEIHRLITEEVAKHQGLAREHCPRVRELTAKCAGIASAGERATCEVERDRRDRLCQQATETARLLRERLAQPPQPIPDDSQVCQPD